MYLVSLLFVYGFIGVHGHQFVSCEFDRLSDSILSFASDRQAARRPRVFYTPREFYTINRVQDTL